MILKAKKLITGDGATVINDAAVAFEEEKIVMVGKAEEVVKAYPNDEVVDYGDATITPALTDMHVHIGNLQSKADQSAYTHELTAYMAAWELGRSLTKGITAVRDVASPKGLTLALKNARKLGYLTLPRIYSTSVGICMRGGHGYPLANEPYVSVVEADSPWNIRHQVRDNVVDGAEWIKVLTSHGEFAPQYTQEELDAAVDEAHRLGRKASAHAGYDPSMEMCIKAGFDTIEHGSFLTPEEVETMVKNGQTWVPTILPYVEIYNEYAALIESMGLSVAEVAGPDCDSYLAKVHEERPELDLSVINEELVDVIAYMDRCVVSYKANLRKYADMGVTIVAGTDMVSSNDPMVLVAKELKLMVEYGLTTLEAVKAATSAPAKVLGIEKKYGLLEKGKIAEIAVFKGDVEKDITALEDCVATFMSGKKVYGE